MMFAVALTGCKRTSDASLATKIQGAIAADSAMGGQPVQVAVQDGVATLTGSVSNDAQRVLAARDAAAVDGVKEVVDSIAIATVEGEKMPATRARPEGQEPPPYHQGAPIERPQEANNPSQPAVPPLPSGASQPVNRTVTVAAGTTIPVRVTQTLDSASTQPNAAFSGVVASDIVIDGVNVIPSGSNVAGHVDAVHEAAHFAGSSLLSVSLSSINRRGERTAVTTEPYTVTGKGRGVNTAEKAGGGAAIGALLGAIFGGGKGAAIGAAAGGGLGAGSQAITRGQQVQIASESIVRFHLSAPLTLRAQADGGDKGPVVPGLQRR